MQPLQFCIGPTIHISWESWCLPYAGFFGDRSSVPSQVPGTFFSATAFALLLNTSVRMSSSCRSFSSSSFCLTRLANPFPVLFPLNKHGCFRWREVVCEQHDVLSGLLDDICMEVLVWVFCYCLAVLFYCYPCLFWCTAPYPLFWYLASCLWTCGWLLVSRQCISPAIASTPVCCWVFCLGAARPLRYLWKYHQNTFTYKP